MNGHSCTLGGYTVWDDGSLTLPDGTMDPPGTWIYNAKSHVVSRADGKSDQRIRKDACQFFSQPVTIADAAHASALAAGVPKSSPDFLLEVPPAAPPMLIELPVVAPPQPPPPAAAAASPVLTTRRIGYAIVCVGLLGGLYYAYRRKMI